MISTKYNREQNAQYAGRIQTAMNADTQSKDECSTLLTIIPTKSGWMFIRGYSTAVCLRVMRCWLEVIRSNRTEGIILMRKRGSRGCAAGLIYDVDFHDTKSVRIRLIRVIRVLSSFRSSYKFVLVRCLCCAVF